tara:strand:+ start:58 stop:327 length:270 start_codon:yes stop_codon:yes gene_type:complete
MTKEKETKKIKLTEDEIKELTEIRKGFSNMALLIGEAEIGIANLNARKQDLVANLQKLREKESDTGRKLEDKYGKGSISLETNEFTATE